MERANRTRKYVASAVAIAVAVLLSAGCSQREPQPAPMPPPSVTTIPASQPLPALPPPATASVAAVAAASPADTNGASGDDQTQAELAAQVKALETQYESTPDFQKRVTLIYELSSNDDGADVIDALAHLFLNEKDQELKIELVNSLSDVDGQNDKKLAILSTAMRSDQPKEVRMEAIDAMGDTDDKRGIQILQGYLNDSDEDVRDDAESTIEQLKNTPEQSPQPAQSQITGHANP